MPSRRRSTEAASSPRRRSASALRCVSCEASSERMERTSHAAPAASASRRPMSASRITGRATVLPASDGQKISPGESEDLPELSAGSVKPEDSPDPTGASYRGVSGRSTRGAGKNSQRADIFISGRLFAGRTSVRTRSLCVRVHDAFRSGGALAATLPGFEPRAEQAALADAVDRALATGEHLVAEAGTGTGKSLAYLLPALESGQRVVVATATDRKSVV